MIHSFSTARAIVLSALFSLLFLPGASLRATAADANVKVYSGAWNNRKYKTKGPLLCNLTISPGNTWKAKFTGKGLGRPFTYNTDLTVTRGKTRLTLKGVSSVDGERYNWAGYISGANMVCSYRSASGNNGTFQLRQTR